MVVPETGSALEKKKVNTVPDNSEVTSASVKETISNDELVNPNPKEEGTTKVSSATASKNEKNALEIKKRKLLEDNESEGQNGDVSQKEDHSNSESPKKEENEEKPDTKRRKKEKSNETSETEKSTTNASFASFKSSSNINPFAAALEKAKKQSSNKKNLTSNASSSANKSIFGSSSSLSNTSKEGDNSNNIFNGSKATFCSSFGTGGTKSSIFGSSSNISKTSIFGGSISGGGLNAFGSTTPFTTSNNTNGGGSILWGSSLNKNPGSTTSTSLLGTSSMSKSLSKKKSQTSILMQESTESVKNGEENEESILQYRAKLYRLIPKTSTEDESKQPNWREVGIGPLRILKTKKIILKDSNESDNASSASTYRIVQRRECTPGGPGTKVILNIVIGGDVPCTVTRQADKYVQLATVSCENVITKSDNDCKNSSSDEKINDSKSKVESEGLSNGDPVMYLFKVKTVEEADDLQKKIEGCINNKK